MPRGATEAHAPQLLSLHATTTGLSARAHAPQEKPQQ